jgi:hypothetical protein
VRRELTEFLRDREGWPTAKAFKAAHRVMLLRALAQFGGRRRWAADFGRELRPSQRVSYWTDERIEEALRGLSCDGMMPTLREMRPSGRRGLANAVGPPADRLRWAERLGLELRPASRQPAIRWTNEAIEKAVRRLLRGRCVYPTQSEFKAAGLGGVYQRIGHMPGGHYRCAEGHGLPGYPRPRPAARSS